MATAFKLYTGHLIPAVGLGTYKLLDPETVKQAVHTALLDAGYGHVDCAEQYKNQKLIGDALQSAFQTGKVKREEVFITSKLWINHYDPQDVRPALNKILKDLKLNYLDLFLLHWPVRARKEADGEWPPKPEHLEPFEPEPTWRAMEKLVDDGVVRHIGVSNFTIPKLQKLLGLARIQPAVHQTEMHPMWRYDKMLTFCEEHHIHVTAYAPLGHANLLQHPLVEDIAAKLHKTPAQVLIRWAIQRGTSAIPKSKDPERIKQNIDVFSWSIPDEDFKKLSSLPKQRRVAVDGSTMLRPDNPHPYKTLEEFWDGEV